MSFLFRCIRREANHRHAFALVNVKVPLVEVIAMTLPLPLVPVKMPLVEVILPLTGLVDDLGHAFWLGLIER